MAITVAAWQGAMIFDQADPTPPEQIWPDTHAAAPLFWPAAGSVGQVRSRRCSRAGCGGEAVSTLTYVYVDSTAVLGPLATTAEPHGYDLCGHHARALSVPRGWEVIRLTIDPEPPPSSDDLLALADAVREVGLSYDQLTPDSGLAQRRSGIVELGRRGHLTVLADPDA
jgi:hypothetical protein